MILDQAFRYITELKKQNDTMLLEGGDKVQGEVKQLHICSQAQQEFPTIYIYKLCHHVYI